MSINEQPHVQKEATYEYDHVAVKIEGLEDGYRFSVRGDTEKIKEQRRVGASFINFLRQADKAGWKLPLIFRWLLKFWGNYRTPGQNPQQPDQDQQHN